jgi:undecaprenyl-diphosphatase
MIESSDAEPGTADASARAYHGKRLGLPNRRWWAVPSALLTGFVFLLWQVISRGPVTGLDTRVRNGIQDVAGSPSAGWMFHPARAAAELGDPRVSLPVLGVATAVAAWASRSWRPALVTAGALAALATVVPLKLWTDRPGPGRIGPAGTALGFFPSGHTADAVLCYGTGAVLLCGFAIREQRPGDRVLRRLVWAAATGLVLLTVFGLLWSNFHWLSDALGSLCWGGAALAALRRIGTLRRKELRR